MRRLALLLGLITVFVLVTAQAALAAGWWVEYGLNSGNLGDDRVQMTSGTDPLTNPNTKTSGFYADSPLTGYGGEGELAQGQTPSPHGGFTVTTNKCKTCHAVHGANNSSFRLLHDSSRLTECEWCHDATTGRSSHRPYGELALAGLTVRGEHTLGATKVPDSNTNTPCDPANSPASPCTGEIVNGLPWGRLPGMGDGATPQGLNCYVCHSVHGADTIMVDIRWRKAIVRRDPARNGGPRDFSNEPMILDWKGDQHTFGFGAVDYVKAAFCGDCHNRNPNWGNNTQTSQAWNDTNNDGIKQTGETFHASRPNPASHPTQGDGLVEIYGQNGQTVSPGVQTCTSCHSGTTFTVGTSRSVSGTGDFPHQTQGHKLLFDGANGADLPGVTTAGDPYRPIPAMDEICLSCHGGWVGVTF